MKFYSTKVQYIDKNMLDLEKLITGKASNSKGMRILQLSLMLKLWVM